MKDLFYIEKGDPNGQLLLFIHGGFTNLESYQHQFDAFPDYHCVFVDLPEYGKSKDCGLFSFEHAAKAVQELIEKLSPDRKILLVSHSYGGLVAKQLLTLYPEKIDKLIVGSTNLKRDLLFYLYTHMLGCLILALQNQTRYRAEGITWGLIRRTQKSAWKNFTLPGIQSSDPKSPHTSSKQISAISIPTLLLYAQYDAKEIKNSMQTGWKQYCINSQIREIKDSDHIYFWNHAKETNALLQEFLKSQN